MIVDQCRSYNIIYCNTLSWHWIVVLGWYVGGLTHQTCYIHWTYWIHGYLRDTIMIVFCFTSLCLLIHLMFWSINFLQIWVLQSPWLTIPDPTASWRLSACPPWLSKVPPWSCRWTTRDVAKHLIQQPIHLLGASPVLVWVLGWTTISKLCFPYCFSFIIFPHNLDSQVI